jgi:hypothetical protein
MAPEKAQGEVRKKFPELALLQLGTAAPVVPPVPDNVAKTDAKRSDNVRKLLEFADRPKGTGEAAPKFSGMLTLKAFETKPRDVGGVSGVTDLTEAGKKDVIDLAVALKQRANAKGVSDDDKAKYNGYLAELKEFVGRVDKTQSVGGSKGKTNWSLASQGMSDDMLNGLVKALEANAATKPPVLLAGNDPLDWLKTMQEVTANAKAKGDVNLPKNLTTSRGEGIV